MCKHPTTLTLCGYTHSYIYTHRDILTFPPMYIMQLMQLHSARMYFPTRLQSCIPHALTYTCIHIFTNTPTHIHVHVIYLTSSHLVYVAHSYLGMFTSIYTHMYLHVSTHACTNFMGQRLRIYLWLSHFANSFTVRPRILISLPLPDSHPWLCSLLWSLSHL